MIVRDYERDSAMSKMIGSVHTTSEEFENGTLFLRLGLPYTLIRHENALQTGEIWKRSFISTVRPTVHTNPWRKWSFSKPKGISKRRLCALVWTENILKTELCANDNVTIITWFPCRSFPQTQIQNSRRCAGGKHLMRFLSEASVFHFSAVVCGTRSKDLQCAVYITACGIRLRLSTIERLGWRFRGITIQYVRLSFLRPPPPRGGEGTLLYGLYRYVQLQRVCFFSRFGHK